MRVENVMTKEVSFCGPATNAAAAAEIMWTRNCGALPILDDGRRVIGIVTDRDLFIALGTSNRKAADLPVGEIMTQNLSFCGPDDDVRNALKTMGQRQVHRLLVVDRDGALKGILSMDDIVLRTEVGGVSNDEVVKALRAICEHQVRRAAA
jgi:CBS domain-containing protein